MDAAEEKNLEHDAKVLFTGFFMFRASEPRSPCFKTFTKLHVCAEYIPPQTAPLANFAPSQQDR